MNMRMRCFRGILTAAVILLSSLLSANALTNVVIFQSSFESPDGIASVDGKFEADGWLREHQYSRYFHEDNTNLGSRVPTPFGKQYASIWHESGIITTNITDRLQPGVTYTLTFNVGNAGDTGAPDVSGSDYLAELLAGTNVLASVTGTTDSNDFSIDEVLTYTSSGTNAYLGKILGVRLAHGGPAYQFGMLIDNVKFVADESASEWKHTLHIGK